MSKDKLPSVGFVEKLLDDPFEANMYFANSKYVPVDVSGRIDYAVPIPDNSGKGVKMTPAGERFKFSTSIPEEVAQSNDLIQSYVQAAIRDQHAEFLSVSHVTSFVRGQMKEDLVQRRRVLEKQNTLDFGEIDALIQRRIENYLELWDIQKRLDEIANK